VNTIDAVAERSPLGGLERWLGAADINEVMVNNGGEIWVDSGGVLRRVGTMSTAALLAAIERILIPTGRRIDRSSPMVDARLPGGARVCAVIEPVATDGPCLAIRLHAQRSLNLSNFASTPVVEMLRSIVDARCNVVVTGATSSGKSSLLAALAAHAQPTERLVVLEDIAELDIAHPHVVRLEARPATADGVGAVTLGDLLRTALRMRPDRLIVGEVRGSEATALLQALNTGHDGSLSTVHANSALDGLARLASLVVQATPSWPLAAIDDHVRRAVDVVVQVSRRSDGSRRIVAIGEVDVEGDGLRIRPLVEADRVVATLRRVRR
jgi:pilus assembly protein CpaF